LKRIAKNAAGFVLLLLDLFLISVAPLHHYPFLFSKTCAWQLPVYLSVSASVLAEGLVKLLVSSLVLAKSQYITFGVVSVSAETRHLVSVGLYVRYGEFGKH